MRHGEIKKLLGDFAAGRLDRATRAGIEAHLKECVACDSWVSTYGLYADLLGVPAGERAAEHPPADRLAEHALDLPGLEEADRSALMRHLESCPSCRRQVELTRQAVSRTHEDHLDWAAIAGPAAEPAWMRPRAALAAGVLFALLATAMLWSYLSGGRDTNPLTPGGTALEGTHLFESRGAMIAAETEIRPRAEVTYRSGEAVVFGEGFSVGSEAVLIVEIRNVE